MTLGDVTNFLGFTTPKKVQEPIFAVPPSEGTQAVPIEKKVFLSWEVTERPKFTLDKKTLKTVLVILAVISLLLVSMQEYFLVLVLASIIFICYVLSITPPGKVSHEISNKGVSFAGQFYGWHDLRQFFFYEKDGNDVLAVDTQNTFPVRLFFVLSGKDKDKIREYLSKYLTYIEEPPKNFMDKMYDSVASKINLAGE